MILLNKPSTSLSLCIIGQEKKKLKNCDQSFIIFATKMGQHELSIDESLDKNKYQISTKSW